MESRRVRRLRSIRVRSSIATGSMPSARGHWELFARLPIQSVSDRRRTDPVVLSSKWAPRRCPPRVAQLDEVRRHIGDTTHRDRHGTVRHGAVAEFAIGIVSPALNRHRRSAPRRCVACGTASVRTSVGVCVAPTTRKTTNGNQKSGCNE